MFNFIYPCSGTSYRSISHRGDSYYTQHYTIYMVEQYCYDGYREQSGSCERE